MHSVLVAIICSFLDWMQAAVTRVTAIERFHNNLHAHAHNYGHCKKLSSGLHVNKAAKIYIADQ